MQFNCILGLFFALFVADSLENLIPSKSVESVIKPVNSNILNIQGRYNDEDAESCDGDVEPECTKPYYWTALPCDEVCSDPNPPECCENERTESCNRTIPAGLDRIVLFVQYNDWIAAKDVDIKIVLSEQDCGCQVKVLEKDLSAATIVVKGVSTVLLTIGVYMSQILQNAAYAIITTTLCQ